MIIQLTGLSKSGKTTLANTTKSQLDLLGYKCEVIDADEYRKSVCSDLGFTMKDRIDNIRRLQFIAQKFSNQEVITIIAAINPYEDVRNEIDSFVVHLSGPGRELEMYEGSEYEVPTHPDLVINTIEDSIEESVSKVINLVLGKQEKTIPKALFIGRWQPFHKNHERLIGNKLNKGIPVLIAVRDILPDEKNPFTTVQTIDLIKTVYENNPLVEVISIPDIESVNYGRGVGYEINQFVSDNEQIISGTQIRSNIKEGKEDWKSFVDESIHEKIIKYLSL